MSEQIGISLPAEGVDRALLRSIWPVSATVAALDVARRR